jgi:hypothetical protein
MVTLVHTLQLPQQEVEREAGSEHAVRMAQPGTTTSPEVKVVSRRT